MMNKDENLAKAYDFQERAEKVYKQSISKKHSCDRFHGLDESMNLMKSAANLFRLAKDWKNAANAFLKAAKTGKENDCLISFLYEEAAKMQMKFDKKAAVQSLELKAEWDCMKGHILSGACAKEKIGEIHEAEKEFLLAAKSYSEAFELYEMDSVIVYLNKYDLLLKAAEMKVIAEASRENIEEALEVYESVISKYREAQKDTDSFCLIVFMLHLANGNVDGTKKAIEKCVSLNSKWRNSQAEKSIGSLVKAFQEKDFQKVSDIFYTLWETQWNKPLKQWRTAVLNRIRAQLGEVTKGEFSIC